MRVKRLLFPLLAVASLTGCSGNITVLEVSSFTVGANRKLTDSSITYSVKKADGTTIYSFNVKQSHSLQMKAEIIVDLGALTITLTDPQKNDIYKDIVVENADFTIDLSGTGKYKMTIVADAFQGSYKFDWTK